MMEQDKIWDHLQNEECFERNFSEARQRFIVRYLVSQSAVLNIGVGGGVLERLGCQKGVLMHSLDPSEKAIERLRSNLSMGERAKHGYAQAIPFAEESFDGVVMSEVMEHLDDDVLAAALAEVWRVLKPNGFLLASTPYREDLASSRVVCPSCGTVFHKMGHVRSFDKSNMRNLLKKNGFFVNKTFVTTFVDWRRKGVWNFVKSTLRLLLARMGEGMADPHLVVLAEKRLQGQ